MMRWAVMCILMIATASVVSQSGRRFSYVDRGGSLQVSASGARMTQLAGPVYRLNLNGSVAVESKSQGLRMNAQSLSLDAVPGKSSRSNEVKRATTNGMVTVVKTTTANGASRQVTLSGSNGTYANRGSDGKVDLAGPVSLVSVEGARQILSATGTTGEVILEPGQSAANPIRSATLSGKVRVVAHQNDGTRMIGTGARLVLNNTAKPATLTLTGGVTIQGEGNSSLGTIQNVAKAILTLNEKGDVVSFEVQ